MPAINIQRLSSQVGELVTYYQQTEVFVQKLTDIFEFYGDKTRRKSIKSITAQGIPKYYVPQQVLNEIIKQLRSKVINAPLVFFNLCSALWNKDIFESKLLASKIIGLIPNRFFDNVLSLSNNWLSECRDRNIYEVLITDGLTLLRKEQPSLYLTFFEKFLNGGEIYEMKMGLFALSVLIQEEDFFDYPSIISVLKQTIHNFPSEVTLELITIFNELSQKAPNETIQMVSQLYSINPNSNIQIILRSIIPQFNPHQQLLLRNLLNKN